MSNPIYVAIDTPRLDDALALATKVKVHVGGLKLGLEFFCAHGHHGVHEMMKFGLPIFLDLKLHDIGNTVTEGVDSLTKLGVTFLTVHAYPQTMRGAVEGRGDAALKLLAVTALTSYDDGDLRDAGYGLAVRDLVRLRAEQARTAGIDGIVCSAAETEIVRDVIGPDMVIVTPGIRPAGSAAGDQKRTLTPGEAIAAGADHLVIGRPVIRAADPRAAAAAIMDEIAGAA